MHDVVLNTVGKQDALAALKENGRAVELTGAAQPSVLHSALVGKGTERLVVS